MADFIRILGTVDTDIDLAELQRLLEEKEVIATLEVSIEESSSCWTMLDVYNVKGEYMIRILRNPVQNDGPGFLELAVLEQALPDSLPASAAHWIWDYFDKVAVVYSFEMYCNNRIFPIGYSIEDNIADYELVDTIITYIWKQAGGLMQTDKEGYTNEEGDTILWQYEGYALYNRDCAVLGTDGTWIRFNIDMADSVAREQFLEGARPDSAVDLEVNQ